MNYNRDDVVKWYNLNKIVHNTQGPEQEAVWPEYEAICMNDGVDLNIPRISALLSPQAFDLILTLRNPDQLFQWLIDAGNWMNDELHKNRCDNDTRHLEVIDGVLVLVFAPAYNWDKIEWIAQPLWALTFFNDGIEAYNPDTQTVRFFIPKKL